MKLFTRKIEGDSTKPPLVILHGLYSSSSNWYPIARSLGYNVTLVDLPNHGHSPWSDTFTYRSIADALAEVITEPCVVMGHSLGGRLAMILAAECEQVMGLIMLDISPVSSIKVERAFGLFHSLFLQNLVEARREGVTDIVSYLNEKGVAEGMTTAIEQAYRQMNIEVVAQAITPMSSEWETIRQTYPVITKPTMIIRGGASPYIPEALVSMFDQRFSNFRVATIEGATHALHREYPDKLTEIVKGFIDHTAW